MHVHNLLLSAASRGSSALFVWDRNRWASYGQLTVKARRIAHFLAHDAHIAPGARVAVLSENSADGVAAFFGVLIAGGTVVPINTDLNGVDLSYILNHSGAELLIVSTRHARKVADVVSRLETVRATVTDADLPASSPSGLPRIPWTEIVETGLEAAVPARTHETDLAAIIYTSGSTGEPKGVMLSHANLVTNASSVVEYLHLTSEDRVMMVLPYFYIYGLSLLLTHTMVGASVVMDNRFMYPNTVLQNMIDTEVTGLSGVPSTFTILLARSSLREMKFPSLRYVTQAGGAMAPATQKEVARAFHPAQLYVMYGATEAAPRLSYLEPADLPRKWGSIGKAVSNVELYVADGDGRRQPQGQEGELVARGPNITAGYWKDPDGSAEVLKHGLYFTGDLAVEDEEGYLFITGRSKDIIKVKGYRVSPREIEECLTELDDVMEAAVIGVPDEVLGEAPMAYVVLKASCRKSSEELRRLVQPHLASYKVPAEIRIVESLPMNAAGKVQKSHLRAQCLEATSE